MPVLRLVLGFAVVSVLVVPAYAESNTPNSIVRTCVELVRKTPVAEGSKETKADYQEFDAYLDSGVPVTYPHNAPEKVRFLFNKCLAENNLKNSARPATPAR